MTLHEELIQKIEMKQAVIGTVGLGYVGLPLILCFAEKGFRSIGFDVDTAKTEALAKGVLHQAYSKCENCERRGKRAVYRNCRFCPGRRL